MGTGRGRRAGAVELTEGGFGDDVSIAMEIDSCDLVPILADGAFTAADGRQGPAAD